jgi:hypothetical protein
MKRAIFSLSLLLTISASTVFANPGTDPLSEKTFKKEFRTAENVKWSQEDGYSKAEFVLGGSRAIAWFGTDGQLVGSVRDLLYNQLPLVVMSSVDKRFKDAAIFDVREVSNNEGTRYRLTLEYKARKYNVSVYTDGTISEILKTKK